MKAAVLPVDNKLVIYRDTADSYELTFTDENGDPLDLTGKTFVSQVRARPGGPLLLDMTVTNTDLANGRITLSWAASDTDTVRPQQARWGLLDSDDRLWIDDTCTIKGKIPVNA